MGRVKDVVMGILQCPQCEGQGWENVYEVCDCNPYEIPKEVIAEWNILED